MPDLPALVEQAPNLLGTPLDQAIVAAHVAIDLGVFSVVQVGDGPLYHPVRLLCLLNQFLALFQTVLFPAVVQLPRGTESNLAQALCNVELFSQQCFFDQRYIEM